MDEVVSNMEGIKMIKFDVCIKSGTSGYWDDDNCNMLIKAEVETEQLPSKGDYIFLDTVDIPYLVTDVFRSFLKNGEFNTVYVIKA